MYDWSDDDYLITVEAQIYLTDDLIDEKIRAFKREQARKIKEEKLLYEELKKKYEN